MSGPIPRARGMVVPSVHHGPVDRERPELTGVLTVQRYGAPKLTMAARGGRGRRGGAHRGQNRATRWRGCTGGGEDRSSAAVLGVGKRRHREAKQGVARVVVWCRDAIGVFYSLGEAVEGRGGGRPAVDI
jgi:hypothetical protein